MQYTAHWILTSHTMPINSQDKSKFMLANDLDIIAINVNSLIKNQRRTTLLELLQDHKPDFALIGETKLSDRFNISFQGYTIVRADRRNSYQGGGTAIIVKDSIKFTRLFPNSLVSNVCLEATVIEVTAPDGTSLIVISAYAPGSNKRQFIPELEALFVELKLKSPANYYIIAGTSMRNTRTGRTL